VTRGIVAVLYAVAIFAVLVCLLRWEFRRAFGHSRRRSAKAPPSRAQKALARWLLARAGEEPKKPGRREAA
jgi:hypothetical protein